MTKINSSSKDKIVISAQNIHKSYGTLKAVNGLSFKLHQSTCFGFLGPNGAGKTTMMNMIYGKCMRDSYPDGYIDVFGYDPGRNELEIKYFSGVVPQENNLDVELNVTKNLLIYSKFYAIPKTEAEKRIERLLEFMELADKKKAKIKELSGGMKRRLIIARALLNNPKLLILDEPTTGLDPQVRHLIWDKLRQLKNTGTTILLTTHYMEEAFQLADQILIMHQGEKLMAGNPQKLLDQNMEKYVLEVQNMDSLQLIQDYTKDKKIRLDRSQEVILLYSDDIDLLKSISENLNPGDYYHRQTNLEDLFLKLTGRELYEKQ